MFSLNVKASFEMGDYIPGDMRIFVAGHSANGLSGLEVKELYQTLGVDFDTHFEPGNEATADLIETF